MRILMVTSEFSPLAKAGGLADMVAALSAHLAGAGHDVRIVMPRYYDIDHARYPVIGGPLGVPLGFSESWCAVHVDSSRGFPVYFLDNEELFGRKGIYGSREEPDFSDNVRRFSFLCRGAFQLCRKLNWIPDVVHAHDWPAALSTIYLNTWEKGGPFRHTGSVLTIHNLGYQGIYDKHEIVHTQLAWEDFHGRGLEFFDRLNLLKGGLENADMLTAVSPTYAREIQTPEFGWNLDGVLRRRSRDLVGILNGMDYTEWNPSSDPLIPGHYSAEDLSGKEINRSALREEMGLADDPDRPIVGMVSRLVDQKGFPELCGPSYGSLYRICTELALDVVILGTGDAWCEEELRSLASRLDNLQVRLDFDNRLSHLIEAGSDFFLMPSRYEPCGLNQMYSLCYGTLPIVHRTGGLADTVENYDEETGAGTGFVFDTLSPEVIFDTVGWANWAWYNRRKDIHNMRKRAMEKRFDWESSAEAYLGVYRRAVEKRKRAVTGTR